ncbi:44933_t:CDS:2 [Gigaspora margarita]|uniref:44933_t:CDS:1 n=1 Tax=Gigaspora margarita TaxID=4874 RepID=A0ABM8VYZ9_GIGMA|nr:44933_t:CDS:2 [Gigaspora margarita]
MAFINKRDYNLNHNNNTIDKNNRELQYLVIQEKLANRVTTNDLYQYLNLATQCQSHINEEWYSSLVEEFDIAKIETIIKESLLKKATGLSQISNEMLKHIEPRQRN